MFYIKEPCTATRVPKISTGYSQVFAIFIYKVLSILINLPKILIWEPFHAHVKNYLVELFEKTSRHAGFPINSLI